MEWVSASPASPVPNVPVRDGSAAGPRSGSPTATAGVRAQTPPGPEQHGLWGGRSASPRDGEGSFFIFFFQSFRPFSLPTAESESPPRFIAGGEGKREGGSQRTTSSRIRFIPVPFWIPYFQALFILCAARGAATRSHGLPTSATENLSLSFSLSFPPPSLPIPRPPLSPTPCSPSFPPVSFFLGWALLRLYGIKCAKCSIGFSKNDFVMRARAKVYHIECFRCVACSRQLIPGDEFALREDGLFCRADHDVVERASLGAGDPLSPLHPSRPLQMAGTARARRPEGARGVWGAPLLPACVAAERHGPGCRHLRGGRAPQHPPFARLHHPTAGQRLRESSPTPSPRRPVAGLRRGPLRGRSSGARGKTA